MRKWGFIGCALVVALLLLIGLSKRRVESDPPLPDPNGYMKLLEAADQVVDLPRDMDEATVEALAACKAANLEALQGIEAALELEGRVPSRADTPLSQLTEPLTQVRPAGRLLMVEGQLYRMQDEGLESAQRGIRLVQFGQMISNGGLLIDFLGGVAYDRRGWTLLKELAPSLTPAEKSSVLQRVEELGLNREPLREVLRRERAYAEEHTSWIQRLFYGRSMAPVVKETEALQAEIDELRKQAVEALKTSGAVAN